jgi:hypothetical protein
MICFTCIFDDIYIQKNAVDLYFNCVASSVFERMLTCFLSYFSLADDILINYVRKKTEKKLYDNMRLDL